MKLKIFKFSYFFKLLDVRRNLRNAIKQMTIRSLLFKYTLRVWLFIIFAAPFLGIWLNAIRIRQYDNVGLLLGFPLGLFLAGLFVTFPWLILFSLFYRGLYNKNLPVVFSKALLSIFSVGCVYFTFYIIGGKEMLQFSNKDGFLLISAYALLAILGPLIFPFSIKAVTEKDFSF